MGEYHETEPPFAIPICMHVKTDPLLVPHDRRVPHDAVAVIPENDSEIPVPGPGPGARCCTPSKSKSAK